MATQTTNLHLKKPAYEDVADVDDLNDNMDTLDGVIGGTTMGTTASTVTGAIAEHETDISTLQNNTSTYLATTGTLASTEAELATLGASMADHQFKNVKIQINTASGYFEADTSYYGTIKRNTSGIYMVDLQGTGSVKQVIHGLYSSGAWTWNSAFGTQVTTVAKADCSYTHNGVVFYKSGNICIAKVVGFASFPNSAATKICTIPAGFRPSVTQSYDVLVDSVTPRVLRFYVYTNGDFSCYNYGSNAFTNNNFAPGITYLL